MTLRLAQINGRASRAGFTLIEILVAFLIFGMTISGLIYGYVQANRVAEFSSMSLAAQSLAEQGMEQARSANWDSQMWPVTNGPGTGDEIAMFDNAGLAPGTTGFDPTTVHTNYSQTDFLDVPSSGGQIFITNYIAVTTVSVTPPLRQIRSDVVWTLPLDGVLYTNTAITQRAPDE
jgi:prepilin-type N-terminal cleavage/methylation domain-containing protein